VAPTIGALEVSSDGATLFAADTTNFKIIALDTDTGAQIAAYPLKHAINSLFNMVYARPFGQPALYTAGGSTGPNGSILAYPSGDELAKGILPGFFIAVPVDGSKIFAVAIGSEPASLYSYSVTQKNGPPRDHTREAGHHQQRQLQGFAVSPEGAAYMCLAAGTNNFEAYSGNSLKPVQMLRANSYPINITVDAENYVVGGLLGLYEPNDIYEYDETGKLLGTLPTYTATNDEQQPAALRVSGRCNARHHGSQRWNSAASNASEVGSTVIQMRLAFVGVERCRNSFLSSTSQPVLDRDVPSPRWVLSEEGWARCAWLADALKAEGVARLCSSLEHQGAGDGGAGGSTARHSCRTRTTVCRRTTARVRGSSVKRNCSWRSAPSSRGPPMLSWVAKA